MPDNLHFSLERGGRLARITVDRPPLNVLNIDVIKALEETLGALPDSVAVVLLKTGGEKAFSAGVDVQDHTPDKLPSMLGHFHGVFRKLFALDAVSLCAVQGAALGGGAELPLLCDVVLASERAKFAFPEIQLACFPPVAMACLSALTGPRRAAELILTGRKIGAQEALALGLVNAVVSPEELENEMEKQAEEYLGKSPAVLKLTARGLRQSLYPRFEEELARAETLYLEKLAVCPDMEEGLRAFVEKRKPVWRG